MESDTVVPGGAANVAVNIAGLRATANLLGVVGTDQDGDRVTETLVGMGIGTDSIVRLDSRATTVKTRVVAHGQHVVRIDREESGPLAESDEDLLIELIPKAVGEADLVILSDYAKGVLTHRTIAALIEESSRLGKPLIADPKGRDFSKYRGATILTPNRREAAEACKLDEATPGLIEIAGQMLLEDLGLDGVLITQSEDGMTLFETGKEPLKLSAEARETYDVTGAGDTVIATFGVAVAAGRTLGDAARIANRAAGIVVGQVGTTAITVEQL
jgi:D-beta-D-heptose 7-phosphate kinase/D-beta-D-heptose 1-phosphate adenosyltransferase